LSEAGLDLISNLVGLLGVGLLALPAMYAARFGRLATRLRNLPPLDGTPEAEARHARAGRELEDQRNAWSPGLNFALLAGTALTALSYVVAILKVFVTKGS
jgi:hypothetical protein